MIFISIYLLAVIDAAEGSKGERLLANSSEFTNSRHPRRSGSRVYEAVVLPEPLQPDMMNNLGIVYSVTEKCKVPLAGVIRENLPEC